MAVYRRYNWHEIWPVAFSPSFPEIFTHLSRVWNALLLRSPLRPKLQNWRSWKRRRRRFFLEMTGTTWCKWVVKICQNWVKIQIGSPKLGADSKHDMIEICGPDMFFFFLCFFMLTHRQIISQILYHFTGVKLSCGSLGGHLCTWWNHILNHPQSSWARGPFLAPKCIDSILNRRVSVACSVGREWVSCRYPKI